MNKLEYFKDASTFLYKDISILLGITKRIVYTNYNITLQREPIQTIIKT